MDIQMNHLGSVDTDGSRVRRLKADEQLQEHALARSALAEHSQRLGVSHLKIDSIQDSLLAECLAQAAHANCDGLHSILLTGTTPGPGAPAGHRRGSQTAKPTRPNWLPNGPRLPSRLVSASPESRRPRR